VASFFSDTVYICNCIYCVQSTKLTCYISKHLQSESAGCQHSSENRRYTINLRVARQ